MAARIQYNTTQVPVNQAFIVSNTTDVFSLAIINGGAGSGCRYGFFSEFSGRIDVSAGLGSNALRRGQCIVDRCRFRWKHYGYLDHHG